jgi:hypothetical protein
MGLIIENLNIAIHITAKAAACAAILIRMIPINDLYWLRVVKNDRFHQNISLSVFKTGYHSLTKAERSNSNYEHRN